ncbi:MAG: Glycosyltransferase [Anaerolineae bacterium]|jgi:glycosyltransferase involved in cell wall biosynthesis|nr:MAG: Glycosyltransferase [Anaerolineae bacterium]
MKIVLVHYSAPPIIGGVESVMDHHARLFADHGHEVRILAGRGATMDERVQFSEAPLLDSRHPDILAVKGDLDQGKVPDRFYDLVDKIYLCLRQQVEDADCIIAHNVCSLHKNLALTAALHRWCCTEDRPRLILWHHDLAWTTPRYQPELHRGYPWDLLRQDWQSAQHVTVSRLRQRELADLLGIPLERIRVIPNGLDFLAFYKVEEQTRRLIEQLNLLACEPLFLLPVRITPRKNIELALQILSALRHHLPEAALVVTGPLGAHNPRNQQYFERLLEIRHGLALEGAAHFLAEVSPEPLPDAVIADFYRIADALLLPSREEGFGIPVLEAGLSRLPVFCADLPPLREIGGDQIYTFGLDESPAVIAARIEATLQNNPICALRRRVRREYRWEGIYEKHLAPLLEGTERS